MTIHILSNISTIDASRSLQWHDCGVYVYYLFKHNIVFLPPSLNSATSATIVFFVGFLNMFSFCHRVSFNFRFYVCLICYNRLLPAFRRTKLKEKKIYEILCHEEQTIYDMRLLDENEMKFNFLAFISWSLSQFSLFLLILSFSICIWIRAGSNRIIAIKPIVASHTVNFGSGTHK